MAKRKSLEELGASAEADRVLGPSAPEPCFTVSAHSGDARLREACDIVASWRKRYRFVIEFEADRDMVPGWGNQVEDWIRLATSDFERQSHYNTTYRVVSTEEIPRGEA